MSEPTFGDSGLSDAERLPGQIGTPEDDAGPSERDPETAADYGDLGEAAE